MTAPQDRITFEGSPDPTLGVEWEVQLVDETGALATDRAASSILAELDGESGYKHELLECTIETITDVCSSVAEIRKDLSSKIGRLMEISEGKGYRVLCAGTHPFSSWADQTVSPDPRYQRLIDETQWPGRRLLIFGVHTHVGVGSGEEAIAISNSLATFIPHLLSLSTSSPYWQGVDTGLASVRTKIFESLPTAGLPYLMDNWGQFQRFMRTLINAGTIHTIREVWWDVRPHPRFGTVELRICDGTSTLDELCAITAFSQAIVVWLSQKYHAGEDLPQHAAWTIRENKWRAARWGLDGEIIRDEDGNLVPIKESIRYFLNEVRSVAEKLGCSDELAGIERILEKGTSTDRQRAVYEKSKSFPAVVDSLVEEMRNSV